MSTGVPYHHKVRTIYQNMLSKYVNDNIMTTNANRFTGDYTKEKKSYGLYTGLFCISIRLTLGSETKHVLFPQFNYHYT